ncbi:MAG TPA: CmcJ/NvfI family oxidoreductase [Stellaceae bacterium]|nr:CmcJ/NvfI family oxidoreductase [Stellaceae bacterium]
MPARTATVRAERSAEISRPYVEASLTYLADASVKPQTYNPPPGTGVPRRLGNYGSFRARIYDARPVADSLSLDREGFAFTRHDTAVADFYDERQLREIYYPEVERLVAAATGTEKVIVFDHTIRTAERAVERGLRAPVQMVHNDYTDKSGPQRVRDLLPAAEAEARLKHRFVEINVWRPIRGPVQAWPLALAEAQSVAPADVIPCDLIYADRTGEILYGIYSPKHRWNYFPRMEREEAVLIKCFDSAKDGRARFSLHTAFEDPTTLPTAPPRESIEVRTLAFFGA